MAETSTKVAFVCSAMTCASEVFPVPAGPKRMTELKLSPSMALRNQLPGPTASICPTTSSSVRGRIRLASGSAMVLSKKLLCSTVQPPFLFSA